MILYHYTTKASFDQIQATKTINPSDPWTTMDASFGRGWYFTDLAPSQCNAWTVAYCWRSLSVFNKVEAYLKFDIPGDAVSRCRDHVYMLSVWDKRINYLEGSLTPGCAAGPCFICDVVRRVKQFFGLV